MSQPAAARRDDVAELDSSLYGHYRARLTTICRYYTSDAKAAEDIVNEALTRAIAHGIPLDARAVGWLAAVARNLCVDHLRRTSPLRSVASVRDFEDFDASCVFDDVIDELDALTNRRALTNAMRSLKATDRRVLWLRDVEGWEYADIAELEGTTAIASRCRASRARGIVRAHMLAALGKSLGVLVGLRWILSKARAARPHRFAVAAGVTALSFGSLLSIEPATPFIDSSRHPVHLTTSKSAPSALDGASGADVAFGDGSSQPGDGGDRAPGSRGLISADLSTEQDEPDHVIPDDTTFYFEVRDPDGNVIVWKRTEVPCKSHKEDPHLTGGIIVASC